VVILDSDFFLFALVAVAGFDHLIWTGFLHQSTTKDGKVGELTTRERPLKPYDILAKNRNREFVSQALPIRLVGEPLFVEGGVVSDLAIGDIHQNLAPHILLVSTIPETIFPNNLYAVEDNEKMKKKLIN
jgi:hypothetical protein